VVFKARRSRKTSGGLARLMAGDQKLVLRSFIYGYI